MWPFSKKEPPGRKAFREEFDTVTAKLRRADELSQVAVGHSVNMANSFFIQRFSTIESFRKLPKAEKLAYIQSLTAMEEKLTGKDPHAAVGFGIFKMWVGALSEDDEELIARFSKELAFASMTLRSNLAVVPDAPRANVRARGGTERAAAPHTSTLAC